MAIDCNSTTILPNASIRPIRCPKASRPASTASSPKKESAFRRRYRPVWTPPQERPQLDYRVAGITSIVWCIGFRTDYSWIDLPVFNGRGQPAHVRGVTPVPGVYFLGLPWLYTWGSGRFSGVARDAEYLAEHIKARVGLTPLESRAALNEAAMGT